MNILRFTSRVAIMLFLVAPLAMAADWPQYRGPNRNGISPEEIHWPTSGPKQLWKASVGIGYSSVSISKGRAYTMGNPEGQETVWCLDAMTGAVIWKYGFPGPLVKATIGKKAASGFQNPAGKCPNATPSVDGNYVYAVSRDGNLVALDAAKGTLVWSADYVKDFGSKSYATTTWGFAASPLVDGNMLIVQVGAKGASVVAFDKTTGKVIWKSGDDAVSYASPLIVTLGGQRMVAMFSAKGLFTYNLADGKPSWAVEWETHSDANTADPIFFGDKVFLTSDYGKGCCLVKITSDDAEEVYHNKKFESHFPCPVMIGDAIYGITGHINSKPKFICYDPITADIKWEKEGLGTGLIAAGKTLLIQAANGNLVAAEATPSGYKEIGNAPALTGLCWTPPSLANGLVYFRNAEGDVVCLDLGGK